MLTSERSVCIMTRKRRRQKERERQMTSAREKAKVIRIETKEGESCWERAGWRELAGPQRSHRSRLALHQRQETWAACFITFPVESSSESLPSTIFSPQLSSPEQQWVLSSSLRFLMPLSSFLWCRTCLPLQQAAVNSSSTAGFSCTQH